MQPSPKSKAQIPITGAAFLSLWRDLGGDELRGTRGRAFWRNGNGWNVSWNPERGLWRCHVTGEGGDAVDLVRVALNVGTGDALAWLERKGYRQPSQRMSSAEIATRRHEREAVNRQRLAVGDFKRALDAELDRAKLEMWDSGDDAALETAASLQHRLRQSAEAVFGEMLERDGGSVEMLIRAGRADREHAEAATALAVRLLAGLGAVDCAA